MHKTQSISSPPKRRRRIIIGLSLSAVGLCLCLVFGSCIVIQLPIWPAKMTRQAQINLTYLHGEAVWTVVQNFEARWQSAEVLENPGLLAEVATRPLLPSEQEILTNWHVEEDVFIVEGILVLEYASERMRVVACLNNPSPGGLLNPSIYLMQYVFVKQDGVWKAAAVLNMNDPDDVRRIMWNEDYGPDWIREHFRGWTVGYHPAMCTDIYEPQD